MANLLFLIPAGVRVAEVHFLDRARAPEVEHKVRRLILLPLPVVVGLLLAVHLVVSESDYGVVVVSGVVRV